MMSWEHRQKATGMSAWKFGCALAVAVTSASWLVGCGEQSEARVVGDSLYFNGMVYDGARGGRVTDYEITLKYYDLSIEGSVDNDGRYQIGPLEPMHDYTVEIVAGGFRSFLSHNQLVNAGGQSRFYDAYLFPDDILAEDATIHVSLSNSDEAVAGFARLQPTTPSLLYDDPSERPAGVNGQVWDNDEDLQFRTVTVPFEDGVVNVEGEDLVYGVTYAVTLFGVTGYQPGIGTFQAGVSGDQAIILQPLVKPAIQLAHNSATLGPEEDGVLVLVFNTPIEFDPPGAADEFIENIDANLVVAPIDGDTDGTLNELEPDADPDDIERGTDVEIDGNLMIITWSRSQALATTDPDDPVTSVTYGGFDQVRIRPVDSDATEAVTLASVVGATSVTVNLVP